MKHNKFLTTALCAAVLTLVSDGGHAADRAPTLEIEKKSSWVEVTGVIQNIDHDSGVMEIKAYTDPEKTIYNQETIYVTREARIQKDGYQVPLEELDLNDEITVRYLVAPDGRKMTYRIWVDDY